MVGRFTVALRHPVFASSPGSAHATLLNCIRGTADKGRVAPPRLAEDASDGTGRALAVTATPRDAPRARRRAGRAERSPAWHAAAAEHAPDLHRPGRRLRHSPRRREHQPAA